MLNGTGVLAAKTIEVVRQGHAVRPLPMLPIVSSRQVGWDGVVLESFNNIPAYAVPMHEHPTNYLNLVRSGRTMCQWTADGRTGSTEEGPGTTYIIPAGTRDQLRRLAPTHQTMLVMAPHFLAKSLEETGHLADVELTPHWNLRDRHIAFLIQALHADLEDGSPAGRLYSESVCVALAHYLIRRYSVRTPHERQYSGGIPTARLNRVLDFMHQNFARETRLWELAELAGMSPHYFCDLFKKSTGFSPHQYLVRYRIERAKTFLRSSKFGIIHVAKATGFVDQSHFTKVFHRIVGVTPTRFRQML